MVTYVTFIVSQGFVEILNSLHFYIHLVFRQNGEYVIEKYKEEYKAKILVD